ncbi:hypothetical protein DPMN_192037 [Dreissena polymorpha]|uniref:EGF-like domain-containing protein n=1 Tax=Dreissena polymorpha TaxID=45954 RepID=A0A9D4BEZ1_DREPO|nr:hypothetical protein DPMN_192037 [Dreissena polymorpha]
MTITLSGPIVRRYYQKYEISTNLFENIQSSSCIVQFIDTETSLVKGTFIYNQLINNKATDGVVLANAFNADIVENILDNPASTVDVYTSSQGNISLNVTKNWWSDFDDTQMFSRIIDQRRVPSFVRFNLAPTLTSREMDCNSVNNCSNREDCVRNNTCRCTAGWTGAQCTDYDCLGANTCYGNGICIGPNECNCNFGWSGKFCNHASCINVHVCCWFHRK